MADSDYLERRGGEILRSIEALRPEFLIEVELRDEELDELFRHLSREELFASRPNRRACLAVAAVHAANRAESEETSYVELFFRRLGAPRDCTWDERYGPAIAGFLHDVFHEPLRKGPFRYVGPIYRHAGVPRRALGSFARLLEALLRDYGPVFTRHEYAECCRGLTVGLVGDFLQSDAGYEFARDAARVLARIQEGTISHVESVPGFAKGFWPDLLERLQPPVAPPPPPRPSPPQLVLDTATWRLGVRWSALTLRSGVRRDGRRVTAALDLLRTGSETYTYESGRVAWELPWSPNEGSAALFRSGDGALAAKGGEGAVRPGDYVLVSRWDERPPQEVVEEDCGYLDWDGDPALRAWRVRLAPGYRNASWDLVVAGDALPGLAFDSGDHDLGFGGDVYRDRLPELIVENWSTEAERLFFICLDVGQGPRRLVAPGPSGRLALDMACPAEGTVWLEPKGRLRYATERLPQLPFAVIPSAIRILGPQHPVREDFPCGVHASLPADWTLHWDGLPVEDGRNSWSVPGGVEVLDGELRSRDISVRVSWRVPRWSVRLRTPHDVGHLLWLEDLDGDATVTVRAPAGLYASLTLQSPGHEQPLWEVGTIPACPVRVMAFRDFLRASSLPAAELGLRLGARPSAPTGVYWLGPIERVLGAVEAPVWERFIANIPDAGSCLVTLSRMRREQQALCELGFALRTTPVQEFVANCAVLAEAVDQASVSPPIEQFSPYASEAIKALAGWVAKARGVEQGQGDLEECARSFPGSLELVPFERWRGAIQSLWNRIQGWTDIPGMIREWIAEVRSGALGTLCSRIAQMPGGWELSQGAVKYMRAVQATDEAQREKRLSAAARALRETPGSEPPVVAALRKALWLMTVHRLGLRLDSPGEWQPPQWLEPAAETLRRLGMLERSGAATAWPDGLGFAEISPADGDGEVEQKLGRPLAADRGRAAGQAGNS